MSILNKFFSKDSKANSESQIQNLNTQAPKERKIRKLNANQNELQSYLNKWDTMETITTKNTR